MFQSTRPRGARRLDLGALEGRTRVSIHAPAWGATNEAKKIVENVVGFNPRARVGRDILSRGIHIHLKSFNPRARVGRDRRLDSG